MYFECFHSTSVEYHNIHESRTEVFIYNVETYLFHPFSFCAQMAYAASHSVAGHSL